MRGQLSNALAIIPDLAIGSAEHDEVFFQSKIKNTDLNPEQLQALDDIGIMWHDKFECWWCFA